MKGQAPVTSKAREAEWQSESDHSTLSRAEEIRGDKKRMVGVRKYHQKSTRALMRIGRVINGRGGARR